MSDPPYVRVAPVDTRLGPFEILVAYSHVDEAMRRALEAHLSPLVRTGRIALWNDRRISAGQDWESEIDERIESSHVVLLLISPEFIASDYCYGVEMTRALERHLANEARVIPVILRPCQWHELPFATIQALPLDGTAITTWANADEAYLSVADGVRDALAGLPKQDIVNGQERLSPSSLVVLRTNLLLRPGRLAPGAFKLVAPDVAYKYESFVVSGVWDATHLGQPIEHAALVTVTNGHVLDYQRAWEASQVEVGLTAPRAAFTILVRSEPDATVMTVRAVVSGFDPEESESSVLLSPFPHGDFP